MGRYRVRINNIIIPNFENNFASKYVPEHQSSVSYAIISLTGEKQPKNYKGKVEQKYKALIFLLSDDFGII